MAQARNHVQQRYVETHILHDKEHIKAPQFITTHNSQHTFSQTTISDSVREKEPQRSEKCFVGPINDSRARQSPKPPLFKGAPFSLRPTGRMGVPCLAPPPRKGKRERQGRREEIGIGARTGTHRSFYSRHPEHNLSRERLARHLRPCERRKNET